MEKIHLGQLNVDYVNKEVETEGILTGIKKQEKKLLRIKYRCPNCEKIATKKEERGKIPKPTKCSCGNSKNFEEIYREEIYEQRILLYGFKVYLRSKNPIKHVDNIKRISRVKVRGIVQAEFKRGSDRGEFIILADKIERVL
jgi:hypothetical protein